MPTWVTWNAHRGKASRHRKLEEFMFLTQARKAQAPASAPAQPAPRTAKPGERPPSRRAPGAKDTTIDRFDSYMKAVGAKVRYG